MDLICDVRERVVAHLDCAIYCDAVNTEGITSLWGQNQKFSLKTIKFEMHTGHLRGNTEQVVG